MATIEPPRAQADMPSPAAGKPSLRLLPALLFALSLAGYTSVFGGDRALLGAAWMLLLLAGAALEGALSARVYRRTGIPLDAACALAAIGLAIALAAPGALSPSARGPAAPALIGVSAAMAALIGPALLRLLSSPRVAVGLGVSALVVAFAALPLLAEGALPAPQRPTLDELTRGWEEIVVPTLSRRVLTSLSGSTRPMRATEGQRRDPAGGIEVVQSCDRSACRVGVVERGSSAAPSFIEQTSPVVDETLFVRWDRVSETGYLRGAFLGDHRIARVAGQFQLLPLEQAISAERISLPRRAFKVASFGLFLTLGLLLGSLRATRSSGARAAEIRGKRALGALALACLTLALLLGSQLR